LRPRRIRRPAPRRWLIIPTLILLILLIIADRQGWLLVPREDELAIYHGSKATVNRVVDGDTIEIDIPDSRQQSAITRIRLWGIDCPEFANGETSEQPLAREAHAMAASLALDQRVLILLEPQRLRDRWGRLLAHVELEDGRNIAAALVEAGLARADDRWPHSMQMRFAQLQRAAQRKGLGLWALDQPPAAGQPED
jgi:micrococcal nuclease